METYNSGTNLSNFYFITINYNDTINNWILKEDDFADKRLIRIIS